ncbi:hypothetical protein CRM22_006583 [Opisthorchis felineus]|uniref:Uncharacterized protein n=1 Tax=Opisthorchis felineus TaxID=147828 RepID=A0A4S2LRQ6_OPIFE|nr:hypothetical protein CRM22_006583 [Opisthorchis felineus]TGZ64050.1 hypothetical protein CRM22_006583 [Opisthorchis felineus]
MQAFKKSTQLTGLAVSKNPHAILKALYNRILKVVALMPEEAGYRKHTTAIVQSRLQAVSTIQDINKLEEAIDCGQIEEVIVQGSRMRAKRIRRTPAKKAQYPTTLRSTVFYIIYF